MFEIFQYWQVNLVIAIALFVVMYPHYRLAAKEFERPSDIPIIFGVIGSIIFLVLIPFFDFYFPTDWRVWALLLSSNILYACQDVLKSKGFKYLDVSVVSIFSQSSKIFLILFGIIIFSERLTTLEIFGIACIMVGSALVVFKKNKFHINKYIWFIIGSSLFFAMAMTIDVGVSGQFNLAFYLLAIYFLPALFIFIGGRRKMADIKKGFLRNQNSKMFTIIAGVASAVGMLFYLLALRQGQVSVVAPLSSITVLLNVLAGHIFLKERDDLIKRIIAAILVIIGVFLLV
jgi:drug/metabolite transporter (DMT)-like permease